MKFTVVMVALVVAATWCGSTVAAGATSSSSATSSGSTTSTEENPIHKKYVKDVADITKMFDEVEALETKLTDKETPINDKIHELKQKDKKGKEVPASAEDMKKQLATSGPSTVAKNYRDLKLMIISGRMDIAKKLGPKDGVYGKCQEMVKLDPKDDALKAQGEALATKVRDHYEAALQKVATLYEAISDTKDEDGIYRSIQAVDPNNPAVTAYFKKKQAGPGK